MQIVVYKYAYCAILLLFHGFGYAQNRHSEDTVSRVILCESTLSYPRAAEEHDITGTVVVLFDIDSNCRIFNIRVEKGIGYGCDEAAINTLKRCKPKFIGIKRKCPAMFNVKQLFTFKKPDED